MDALELDESFDSATLNSLINNKENDNFTILKR